MAKLVLSTGGTIVDQRFLDDERVTIGRDATNTVVVDDPAVAGAHAAITVIGNDYILEDLGSAAGTNVNGVPAQRRVLQHGDVIELGASGPRGRHVEFIGIGGRAVRRRGAGGQHESADQHRAFEVDVGGSLRIDVP